MVTKYMYRNDHSSTTYNTKNINSLSTCWQNGINEGWYFHMAEYHTAMRIKSYNYTQEYDEYHKHNIEQKKAEKKRVNTVWSHLYKVKN